MSEQKFEQSIENFFEKCGQAIEDFFEAFGRIIENFFGGVPLYIQLLVSFIFAVVFLIIGYRLLKRNKKIAGYIFVGLGILAMAWKIVEILLRILF